MNLVRQWIRSFPDPLRNAISEAFDSASLGKVRRALRLIKELPVETRGPILKVELLATFNLEPVLPMLQLAFDCIPSQARLELGPLDAIEAHIAQPELTGLQNADARVVIWRVEELLPEALYPFSNGFPKQLEARVDQVVERVTRVVGLHQSKARGVPLFLSTIALPINVSNPIFAAQHQAGLFASVGRINQKIYELAAPGNGVYVLDLAAWARLEGRTITDATLDFAARQPLSTKGQVALAIFMARCLRPLVMPRRKALAIDLDNTLWGGVVGEDGVAGLQLGHDFPGNVHLRIQRELLELRNRGVLLVLLSKNNEADARQGFDSLPGMLMKLDDFAVRKIDWNHKHENLGAAARELGLGLDSFAFLDDSDFEREQIRHLMPEVQILNESGDPLHMLRSLWETDAFDSLTVSNEDRQRHEDYALRVARNVAGHEENLEAFLKSLEMEAIIEEVGTTNLDRVVTLLGKTNQFNLTTRRHSRAHVQAMLELPGSIALALRLRDKFGDQGIVAVLLAVPAGVGDTLSIDSFLVSCRALGRGVEDALWAAIVKRAQQQKLRRLEAEYIPSAKNKIVAGLYDRLGLQRLNQDACGTRYVLEPLGSIQSPSWIVSRNGAYGG